MKSKQPKNGRKDLKIIQNVAAMQIRHRGLLQRTAAYLQKALAVLSPPE